MTATRNMYDFSGSSFSSRCDTLVLGRLGSELAHIYQDTLHSPLPPRLQALIDRLEEASRLQHEQSGED